MDLDLNMEKERVKKSQVRILRIGIGFSNQVPRETAPKERGLIVDPRASLLMMSNSNLIPAEQGTIQKSKDPSVI